MQQAITGFHLDAENHWVAELACGHYQHVRHNPPWIERPWVVTEAGRRSVLGQLLDCKKCEFGAPPDRVKG
jgi:Protein of unknown function (DUF3565)